MTKILYIEDEQELREYFAVFLRREGFEVVAVADAQAAIDRLQEPFDLVLSDFNLGRGGNGMDILKQAREKGINTPFVILSGNLEDVQKHGDFEQLRTQIKAFIPKGPRAGNILVPTIRSVLGIPIHTASSQPSSPNAGISKV